MKEKGIKRVLFAAIILVIAVLLLLYAVKAAIPGFVLEVAQSEKVVLVGNYIDNHLWANLIASSIISFAVAYLYFGAVLERFKLNWKQLVAIAVMIVIGTIFQYFVPNMSLAYNIVSMVAVPAIFKPKVFPLVFTFCIHIAAQYLAVEIRGIGANIADRNFATFLVILIDHFVWLILLFLLFNYKGGKKDGKSDVAGA